ncbi:N-acetylmuramoyl-L-alanine amidase [Caldibacillus lycopersici]|uniref:N-acetylmuramoyl-L-alanine amidase n=1 Tax=Perspicuibacillus lycopersici TaxID=1325689 RepID=A0AAE3IRY7_9BACI|nr:N-acetylmuramoyl-L-alanine amidase [Perspicuibacillus lycopersici]MCU9613520.1 N-acetylmuramoyl-L-alanine amidase [Perspicuibacillus lycopersici]
MRRILVFLVVLVLLAGCSFVSNADNRNPKVARDLDVSQLAMAEPLAGKVVVLDPGHGGKDPGAMANDLIEKEVNLVISKYTKRFLEEEGATVILTRKNDREISLEERSEASEKNDADIFVSIHNNTNELPSIHGTEVYYNEVPYEDASNPYPEESKRLAEQIYSVLTNGAELNPMGVKDSGYNVLRNNTVPSVIVEVAFISNEDDAERLKDKNQLQQFGQLIGQGISDYLLGYHSERYASDAY